MDRRRPRHAERPPATSPAGRPLDPGLADCAALRCRGRSVLSLDSRARDDATVGSRGRSAGR